MAYATPPQESPVVGGFSATKGGIVMVLTQSYPVSVVCRVVGYSRSSLYEHREIALRHVSNAAESAEETAFRQALQQIHDEHPTYGYCRSKVEQG
jgi:hypothetical protein